MSNINKSDIEHLEWIHGRLIDVYNENRNVDFVLRLNKIINKLKTDLNDKLNSRSYNELELLAEDLEYVTTWLDNKNVPRMDIEGNEYSVIGRISHYKNYNTLY